MMKMWQIYTMQYYSVLMKNKNFKKMDEARTNLRSRKTNINFPLYVNARSYIYTVEI